MQLAPQHLQHALPQTPLREQQQKQLMHEAAGLAGRMDDIMRAVWAPSVGVSVVDVVDCSGYHSRVPALSF